MTIFKDPENINYIFYGVIAVLAVVSSLFFGKPENPAHLQGKSKEYIKTQKDRLKNQ